MPARLSRHALAAGAASCVLAFATAGPAIARPDAGPPPQGAHDARADPSIATSSLAGTTEANHGLPSASSSEARIAAPDEGTTTAVVVLIAGGALLAGAGAGFAGGRRASLRTQ